MMWIQERTALTLYLVIVGTAVLLGLVGLEAEAETFSEDVGPWEVLSYDITVSSTADPVVIELVPDPFFTVYDPQGEEMECNLSYFPGVTIDFHPTTTGTYALIVYGGWLSFSFEGNFSHPARKTTVQITGTIADQQNLTYDIVVENINKPLVVSVAWEDDFDRIYCHMHDPDGEEINPDMDGGFTGGRYIYDVHKVGTYILTVKGSRVESADTIQFNGTVNYPLASSGSGSTGPGSGILIIFVIILISAVAGGAAAAIVRAREHRQSEPPGEEGPVVERHALLTMERKGAQGQMQQPPQYQQTQYAQQQQYAQPAPPPGQQPPAAQMQYQPQKQPPPAPYQQPQVQHPQYQQPSWGSCPACGAVLESGAQFCGRCGRQV